MTQVFVSIGSNIERETHVRAAVQALNFHFGELALSSVYETEAVGFDGDPFYNLVAGFQVPTTSAALPAVQQIMNTLRSIENDNGRERHNGKFSARTLDLDLLLFGDADLHAQGVDVPREEITRYAFVLGPLAEIAPQLAHPLLHQSYAELWRGFQTQQPTVAAALWRVEFVW